MLTDDAMRRTRPWEWDALARAMAEPQFQDIIARYKREENLELVSAWAPLHVKRLLKTDLFEEGFGKDAILDVLAAKYPSAFGMDVSHVVAVAASRRIGQAAYVASDVCDLPYAESVFDLIVSISTLDHLDPPLLPRGLGELCRVLTPGGCLILTLDSRHNPLHVLSNNLRWSLGKIHAERCYKVDEVRAALTGLPVVVTDETSIYHVPFPVNFLAKKAERLFGSRTDGVIEAVVRRFQRFSRYRRTRFLTGRYIALRIVKR